MAKNDRYTGKRINLTLTVPVHDQIERIAKFASTGKSTIIREFLEESLPGLTAIADALEMASRRDLDAFDLLANQLRASVESASQLELEIRAHRKAMPRKRKHGAS